MYHLLVLIILPILSINAAHSEDYDVFLTTANDSQVNKYEGFNIYGQLHTLKDKEGKVQTRLGPFSDRYDAQEVLNEVRVAGHSGAALIVHEGTHRVDSHSVNYGERYNSNKVDIRSLLDKDTLIQWNKLTPAQQASISYFNGELLVKDGDKYVTMDDFTRDR